ncbi:hypothetical protein FBY40_1296 [Microbacterium sp. SLBN-154]|uniref:DUF6186 family protein n=1 Tax=Microbacterium sp. SLBN-154 TaxID=2768458 RepID=UPI001151AAD3|nr:DUF6186 family protein [Microbacterium sp. SLBN-154]TQK18807.1 hypothetical protein FBY40_1296 [Microbacterium sp. SLBN-154]
MRQVTIAGYLLVACGAVAMTALPRVRPDGFAPATSVLDDTLASMPARITLITFWWWLGWHFLIGS